MSRTITIINSQSTGATFLDWSLQFLSGETEHFNSGSGKLLALPENPLTGLTAHLYIKNNSMGLQQFRSLLMHVTSSKTTSLNTLFATPETNQEVTDILKYAATLGSECVIIDNSTMTTDYYIKPRNLRYINHNDETRIEFANIVEYLRFTLSLHSDKHANNSYSLWELREYVAINQYIFKLDQTAIEPPSSYDTPVMKITATDLYNGSDGILNLMTELKLPISTERKSKWLAIHAQWSKLQLKHLNYRSVMSTIVNSILNCDDYDLTEDDLDFYDESYILSELIYKHGKTLKLFDVNKFPNNTNILHTLLEDSFY